MSLYNYVDTPNPNLICCICRAPFTDPTTSLTCSHTFCGDCITRALSHSPTCPVDRTPLRQTDLAPANPIVRSLVDELVVECVYRAEGCSYTAQRQVMPQHLRDACLFAEVTCEEAVSADDLEDEGEHTCNERVRRKDLSAHQRKAHGRKEEAPDSQPVKRIIAVEEHREDPPEAEIRSDATDTIQQSHDQTNACPHASVGCPYTGPLPPSEHLISCPYESLKGFFSLNAARSATDTSKIALLTEQNLILRHKVDMLESSLQVLKREMSATKQALGPWYRSAYASTPRGTASTSAPASTSRSTGSMSPTPPSANSGADRVYQHESRRSTSGGHITEMGMSSRGPEVPGVDANVPDRLASYFPSLPGTDTAGHLAFSPPSTTSSTIPHANLAGGTSLIPPLDLAHPSLTLEGTLTGLHASLGGLAAGVDALGRRSELALANETLRMGEEMMSVRAQMHGLRMQVHGMMMDRNAGAFGGFVNQMGMNGMNNAASPSGAPGAPPLREEGQFRVGFMGPPSITKL